VKSQQSLKLRILDYVFTFFLKRRFKKRKKSRFLDFQKNVKNVFSNYAALVAQDVEKHCGKDHVGRVSNKP